MRAVVRTRLGVVSLEAQHHLQREDSSHSNELLRLTPVLGLQPLAPDTVTTLTGQQISPLHA